MCAPYRSFPCSPPPRSQLRQVVSCCSVYGTGMSATDRRYDAEPFSIIRRTRYPRDSPSHIVPAHASSHGSWTGGDPHRRDAAGGFECRTRPGPGPGPRAERRSVGRGGALRPARRPWPTYPRPGTGRHGRRAHGAVVVNTARSLVSPAIHHVYHYRRLWCGQRYHQHWHQYQQQQCHQ